MKPSIGRGNPNTLYSGGLDSLIEDFHHFCEIYLYPLVNGLVKTKQLNIRIQADMNQLTKIVQDVFDVYKSNKVFEPSLMYYKGANQELPDEAECIEIVGVKFEFDKEIEEKMIMKPVCVITPEPLDGVKVLGTYIGMDGNSCVFVASDIETVKGEGKNRFFHKGLKVVQVSREPNTTEFNIFATYIPRDEVVACFNQLSSAPIFSSKVVKRAELLGVINATDYED